MIEDEIGVDVVVENKEGTVDIKSDVLKGEKGDPTATIQINSVTTGEPGTNASINNVGTKNNMKLNIVIPRGDKGEKGEDGYTPVKGTDYFTEAEIQQIKSEILVDVSSFNTVIVEELPTENVQEDTLYLIAIEGTTDKYSAYIYVNNAWRCISSAQTGDSLPIGTIVEYDGTTVPERL